jgi:hypothetical protein
MARPITLFRHSPRQPRYLPCPRQVTVGATIFLNYGSTWCRVLASSFRERAMRWLLVKIIPNLPILTILMMISCAMCAIAQAAEVNPP